MRICFPAAEPPPEVIPEPAGEPAEVPAAARLSALIIDDEPAITELVEQALEKWGWESTALSDSTAVEAALSAGRFDFVICDLKMPGKSGIEVLRMLRDAHPELARRFLVMTGDMEDVAKNAEELAGIPVLCKPFTLLQLKEAILALVQKIG